MTRFLSDDFTHLLLLSIGKVNANKGFGLCDGIALTSTVEINARTV
ncbi:hypothetical protein HRG84_05485 [Flavisolibacter sp. BT320]|nr:hypothetical protein [Flavisolibacter longurius]